MLSFGRFLRIVCAGLYCLVPVAAMIHYPMLGITWCLIPILILAVTSNVEPIVEVDDVAENILAQRISQIDGVSLVRIGGQQQKSVRVQIDPSVGSEDRDMLEDLIAAAVNDAVHRIESASQAKMQAAMGGMSLPPGMKLPF